MKIIHYPNSITAYINEETGEPFVLQDIPIYDEEAPSEIIGYSTVSAEIPMSDNH